MANTHNLALVRMNTCRTKSTERLINEARTGIFFSVLFVNHPEVCRKPISKGFKLFRNSPQINADNNNNCLVDVSKICVVLSQDREAWEQKERGTIMGSAVCLPLLMDK